RGGQGLCAGGCRGAGREEAEAGRLQHEEVAARGKGPGRLEPERSAQDDSLRLFAARERAANGLDAADLGGSPQRSRVLRGRRSAAPRGEARRSEEHTSELQSPDHLVCRLLLEK